MPAFTFEKISSPVGSAATAVTAKAVTTKQVAATKSRGLIFSMLDRLATARIRREETEAESTLPRKRPPPD